MASSENLATMGLLRPNFNDLWLSELFSRDTETLTRALRKSLDPVLPSPEPVQTPTPTVSGLSGSDPESTPGAAAGPAAAAATTPKRQRGALAAGGKASKRKSRATKRSQTTFITADAANFRQMVQQVTGVRFLGGGGGAAQFSAPIIKPEPQRGFGGLAGAGRFSVVGACPPTLDTSAALLLDQAQVPPPAPAMATGTMPVTCLGGGSAPAMVSSFVADPSGALDFDAFQSFPTLESWKVM